MKQLNLLLSLCLSVVALNQKDSPQSSQRTTEIP